MQTEPITDNRAVIIPETEELNIEATADVDETKLSGYATPEQIEAWKKEHGVKEIHAAIVDGKIAYFKKASRNVMRAAMSFSSKDKLKYMEVILLNCFVGGDKAVIDRDEEFYGAVDIVPELTKGKLAQLKKY